MLTKIMFLPIFALSQLSLIHKDKTLIISGNGSICDNDVKDVVKEQVYDVVINEGISRLEPNTFKGFSQMKHIHLPESLEFIGRAQFQNTDIRDVNIPSRVSKIETFDYLFYQTPNFFSITANESNIAYRSFDNCLYNGDFTILYCVPKAKETLKFHPNVKHINSWAFDECRIPNVVIADTIETLSFMTFVDGNVAPEFGMNSKLKYLCECCFWHTQYTTFICPSSVQYLDPKCFLGSSITSFQTRQDSNLRELKGNCFSDCKKLVNVSLPSSLEYISNDAFAGCISLSSIEIDPNCKNYIMQDGMLFNNNKSAIMFVVRSKTSIIIPKETEFISISCLQKCTNVQSLEIDPRNNAFSEKDFIIYSHDYKTALHSIGSLVNASIIFNCTSLSDSLFEGHQRLENFICEDQSELRIVGSCCFKDTPNLKFAKLPSYVHTLGRDCFRYSNIQEFTVPKSLEVLDYGIFMYSKVRKVNCEPECKCYVFSWHVLYDCNKLDRIVLPSRLKSIGFECFKGCTSLASITFPPDLTTISEGAFVECTNLSRIDFEGDNVTTIEKSAFYNCNKLERFECPSKIKELTESVFQKCHCLREFSYPHGSQLDRISNLALSETNLSTFEVPSSVSFIHSGAFKMCNIHTVFHTAEGNLNYSGVSGILYSKDVKILKLFPHGLSECEIDSRCRIIEEGAFSGCSKLETVIFKNYIEVIRSKAFQECSNLRLVRIENNIKEILENSFEKCTRLKDLYIGSEQLIRIGKSSFNGCDNLERVQISKIIKSEEEDKSVRIDGKGESGEEDRKMLQIEPMVFQKCLKLTEVELPNTIEELGSNTFEGCIKLQRIYLPDNLHEISDSLFKGCLNLENVTIPSKVESIQNNAFEGCSKIKYVYYCSSTPSIEGIASMNIFISVPNLKQIEGITLISYPFQNIFGIEAKKIMHRCHVYPTEIFTISVEKNMTDISLFVADIISKDEDNELPH